MAPPSAKTKSDAGLGKTLQKRRAKAQKAEYEEALHTTALPSGMNSITQESSLDEFLNTAQLAGQDFTAERNQTVTLIPTNVNKSSNKNPHLLSDEQAEMLDRTHNNLKGALQVPKRPVWRKSMTREEVDQNERVSFLEWRRSLAELTDLKNLLMTPFERNLSVWRQLWRTIERSQLVVQIVDARNPLVFRCSDLEHYVDQHHLLYPELFLPDGTPPPKKKNLVLLNKADLLTRHQRQQWANYFEDNSINYVFFSALDATTLQEKMAKLEEGLEPKPELNESGEDPAQAVYQESDPRVRILPVEELEAMFLREVPPPAQEGEKSTVGLVGYPNVGKSSTINALLGSKKVSVSSTPGKTKNIQTINLPDSPLILCDCPGLVFPQFANTKAQLLLDGVLPIDQMREHTAPVDLLCMRIPKDVLEATYGLNIPAKPVEEGGTGVPDSRDLLSSYAIARGFFTQGQGNPDESRSARPVLKDFVTGRLLYVHPPPGVNADDFNAENRSLEHLAKMDRLKLKRAPQTRVSKSALTYVPSPNEVKSEALEHEFFEAMDIQKKENDAAVRTSGAGQQQQASRPMFAPHQRRIGNDGRPIEADAMLTAGPQPVMDKKHGKGNKRAKQRSGAGYA